jgi:hypothetical protein
VRLPKSPSTLSVVPGSFRFNASCSLRTCSPLEPSLNTVTVIVRIPRVMVRNAAAGALRAPFPIRGSADAAAGAR